MEIFTPALPNSKSNIRLIHALPKAGPVDVYANGEIVAKNLAFGKFTSYLPLEPGDYEIQLYKSGFYDNPLLTKTINLLPKSASTISVITLDKAIDLFVLKDSIGSPNITNSFLRFINLSPNSPLLTLSLPNNIILFDSVEYVETTGYAKLSPGIYNFKITISSTEAIAKFINNIRLINSTYHTIYIIGELNGTPQIGYLLLKDEL